MSPAARVVAFLRAINVGGHVVPMARLAELFRGLGLAEVETFIASGNVIFSTGKPGGAALEKRIAAHLKKSLGYEVATFLRSGTELAAIVGHRPFAKPVLGSTLYIGFLAGEPGADARKRVAALASDADDFHVHDRELYWRVHVSFSQSKVTGARLEKALGQPTTLRKHTTVEKLAAKLG